jgi:glutathione S-transferase
MRLHRFPDSPYVLKVQKVMDLLGCRYDTVDERYGHRGELARMTGGYIHVPVLVDDDGTVVVESRRICEHLLARFPEGAKKVVPPALTAAAWAFNDFCDGPLEDVLFRIASPSKRDALTDPWERALYTVMKERKFGAGCVDAWEEGRGELIARGRELLMPTARTLAAQPYVLGDTPTLADAALYGVVAMLAYHDSALPGALGESIPAWYARLT